MKLFDYLFYRFYCFSRIIHFNIYAGNTAVFIIVVSLFLILIKISKLAGHSLEFLSDVSLIFVFVIVYLPFQLYYARERKIEHLINQYNKESKKELILGNYAVLLYIILTITFVSL